MFKNENGVCWKLFLYKSSAMVKLYETVACSNILDVLVDSWLKADTTCVEYLLILVLYQKT